MCLRKLIVIQYRSFNTCKLCRFKKRKKNICIVDLLSCQQFKGLWEVLHTQKWILVICYVDVVYSVLKTKPA